MRDVAAKHNPVDVLTKILDFLTMKHSGEITELGQV